MKIPKQQRSIKLQSWNMRSFLRPKLNRLRSNWKYLNNWRGRCSRWWSENKCSHNKCKINVQSWWQSVPKMPPASQTTPTVPKTILLSFYLHCPTQRNFFSTSPSLPPGLAIQTIPRSFQYPAIPLGHLQYPSQIHLSPHLPLCHSNLLSRPYKQSQGSF